MKKLAQALSALALVATLVPALLFFTNHLAVEAMRASMLVASALWFLSTPLWMGRRTG